MIDWTKPLEVIDRQTGECWPVDRVEIFDPAACEYCYAHWRMPGSLIECRFDRQGHAQHYFLVNRKEA